MQNKQRSVLVGLVFALAGVLVAGVSVGIVVARQRRGAADEPSGSADPVKRPGPDQVATDEVTIIDHSAQLPGDMRPDDPSYGPAI